MKGFLSSYERYNPCLSSCIIPLMNADVSFIFDLDGTLWDSRPQVTAAFREIALREFGETHIDMPLVASLMGKTMDDIARAIAPQELSDKEKLAFGERAFSYENEYLSTHPGTPFPGVRETLIALREKGHRLFVVSNCQKGYIDIFAKIMEPFKFDGFLCFGDTGSEKHVTILKLMSMFGIEEAVYVGDTAGDEKQTHLAGLPFVYASYGFGECARPEFTIHSFDEILSL